MPAIATLPCPEALRSQATVGATKSHPEKDNTLLSYVMVIDHESMLNADGTTASRDTETDPAGATAAFAGEN